MKVCSKCKVEKDESEFGKDKGKKNGIRSECKECRKEYRKSEKFKESKLNSNNVVKKYLGLKNIPTNQIPPELIELKRLQLKIKRELKQGAKNESK